MGVPFYITSFFSLAAFNILSLSHLNSTFYFDCKHSKMFTFFLNVKFKNVYIFVKNSTFYFDCKHPTGMK